MADIPSSPRIFNSLGWRYALAWVYVTIVVCDFLVFPLGWTAAQIALKITPLVPWVPLTLGAGGFFHIAICAVLGVHIWRQGESGQ